MRRLKYILLLLAIPCVVFGQKEPDKKITFSISSDFNHGLLYDGHIRVRERAFEGTFLNLKQDLGMNSWISSGGTVSVNVRKKNIFEFAYAMHYFEGVNILPNPTWYNGVLYVPNSKGDIHNTIYNGFELIWKARIFNNINSELYLRTAIHYERLKFYIEAPVDERSPLSEIFEKFWRQQLPLPSVGVTWNREIIPSWLLTAEINGSYLPSVKTWMQEGGSIYLAQSNADIRLTALYHYKFLSVSAGVWFKHYRIKEVSPEDDNEFLLNGFGDKFSLGINF